MVVPLADGVPLVEPPSNGMLRAIMDTSSLYQLTISLTESPSGSLEMVWSVRLASVLLSGSSVALRNM